MRAGHFQLAVDHGKGQPALDQIERILTKLFEPPARQHFKTFAISGRQPLQLFGTDNQARCNVDFTRPNFEQ